MRTWEETIKFDSGLTIGTHCVTLETNGGARRDVLVEVTARGEVFMLAKPAEGDMYSSWSRVRGDRTTDAEKGRNGTIVWGARDPELMKRFDNPVKIIRRA